MKCSVQKSSLKSDSAKQWLIINSIQTDMMKTSLTMQRFWQLVGTALLIGYPVLCAFSQEFLAGAHNFDLLSKRRYVVSFRGAQP